MTTWNLTPPLSMSGNGTTAEIQDDLYQRAHFGFLPSFDTEYSAHWGFAYSYRSLPWKDESPSSLSWNSDSPSTTTWNLVSPI